MIRLMSESDLDQVLWIEENNYSIPWKRSMFLNELKSNPYSNLFVVIHQPTGSTIGYVCFWVVFDELHLLNLSIAARYQGKGLGTTLARWVIETGREHGAQKGSLEVRSSNYPARKLYESIGFRVRAIRPGYYHEPREDGLIMVWGDNQKEERIMKEEEILKEQLRSQNPNFRRLVDQHHRLDERLQEIIRRKTITPREELERKQLQVEKLRTKDQMEIVLREHRRITTLER